MDRTVALAGDRQLHCGSARVENDASRGCGDLARRLALLFERRESVDVRNCTGKPQEMRLKRAVVKFAHF